MREHRPGERVWNFRTMGEDGFWNPPDPLMRTDAEVLAELGAVRIWDTCQDCEGTGINCPRCGNPEYKEATEPCPSCDGTGRTLREGVERVLSPFVGETHEVYVVPASMVEEARP